MIFLQYNLYQQYAVNDLNPLRNLANVPSRHVM